MAKQKLKIERHAVKPYRIGVMDDLPGECGESLRAGLEVAFEEYLKAGLMDRPVDLVNRSYVGQPWENGSINIEVYRDLIENEKVIGIVGPMTTDNCLSLLPELDKLEIPSVGICGSQLYNGEYAFTTPNGGMADEPATIAAWLHGQGHKSIALIREFPSQIGVEYTYHLRNETQLRGLEIIMEQAVSPVDTQENITEALRKLKAVGADCLVYFGLGGLSEHLNIGLKEIDWDPTRIMGTAFVGATWSEERIKCYDGWYGLDQWHEENEVHLHALDLYHKKFGKPKEFMDSVFTCGYDIGRSYAIAISRMRIGTGEALRDALETVTRLPAATGAPGTVVSFSKRDHRGFKGADYLFVRKSENGKNIYVGTAPVT